MAKEALYPFCPLSAQIFPFEKNHLLGRTKEDKSMASGHFQDGVNRALGSENRLEQAARFNRKFKRLQFQRILVWIAKLPAKRNVGFKRLGVKFHSCFF